MAAAAWGLTWAATLRPSSKITSGSSLGGSTNLTFNIKSASVGDVIYVKNGVYRENLPLRVPTGVTVQGES